MFLPKSLWEQALLAETLLEFTHRDALHIGETSYTYRQLDDRSRSIAAMLQGPTAAILPGRTLETYASVVAVERTGFTYVPLNPDSPDDLLLEQISLAAVDTIVVDPELTAKAFRLLERMERSLFVLLLEGSRTEAPRSILGRHHVAWVGEHDRPAETIDSVTDAPLYQLFTSGTTGKPKMVPIPRANVAEYLKSIRSIFDFRSEDRFSQFFNLSFDLSIHDLFVTWTHGGCLCVPKGTELLDPVGFASRNDLSVWFSVPSLASLAMMSRKLRPGSLPKLRHALFCGEALTWPLLEAFAPAAPSASITNLYGPTEATIAITSYRVGADTPMPAADTRTTVPIGRPFAGQEAIVTDAGLEPVRDGDIGELLLGGSQLAPGYRGNPEETARSFVDAQFDGYRNGRWYRTGDLVRQTRDGMVFLGRKDSQVKWRGFRIELGAIEAALGDIAKTPIAVVVPWPPNADGAVEKLIAFVGDLSLPLKDLRRELEGRLPRHMVPAEIFEIDSSADIRNANGKVDRRKIIDRHLAKSSRRGP